MSITEAKMASLKDKLVAQAVVKEEVVESDEAPAVEVKKGKKK